MKISIELLALTGAFETDMNRAAKNAEKNIQKFEKAAGTALKAAGAALVTAAGALAIFVNRQADAIANFQDVAEKIGDTAENVASLKEASDVSATSFDEIAQASIKLTAALSKTNEETDNVAQALAALGLNLEDFKRLTPVEQLDAVAKAMGRFKDSAEKTAVAVALFGRSGAQLLPFLNDLAEGSERQVTLTQAQIDAADAYTKQLARLGSEVNTLSQQYAAELIPVFSDTLKVLRDLAGEFTGLGKAQGELALRDTVREWAQDAVVAFARVAEAITGVLKLLRAIGGSFEAVAADVKFLGTVAATVGGEGLVATVAFPENRAAIAQALEERNKTVEEANQRYIDLWTYNGTQLSTALRKQFDSTKRHVTETNELVQNAIGLDDLVAGQNVPLLDPQNTQIPFRPGAGPAAAAGKPKIQFTPIDPAAVARAAAEARRIVEATAKATADISAAEHDRERASLEALLDANQISYSEYLDRRLALTEASIDEEIAARKRLLEGASNDEQIALDAQIKILEIQRESARDESLREKTEEVHRLRLAYEEASVSARRFLEENARSVQRQITDLQSSPSERRFNAGVFEIEDRTRSEIEGLDEQLASGEIDQSQYDEFFNGIIETQRQAVEDWTAGFAEMEAVSQDFGTGLTGVFEEYLDSIKNVGASLGNDLVGALDQAKDSTAQLAAETILFGEDGSEAWKEIGRAVVTDLVSGLIKAGIETVALAAIQKASILTTTTTAVGASQAVAGAQTVANAQIAASAAPAAGLTSLASFGANAGFAIAGIAAVLAAIKAFGGFQEGGYTGDMAEDDIAGFVHGREFVVTAEATRANRPLLEAMNEKPDDWVSYLTKDVEDNAHRAFATGGLIEGGEQLIRVNERGVEFVVNADATRLHGPLLDEINRNPGAFGGIEAFARGGLIGGGEQLIRVNERGTEFVVNAEATRLHGPLLEELNRNPRAFDEIQAFALGGLVSIDPLDRALIMDAPTAPVRAIHAEAIGGREAAIEPATERAAEIQELIVQNYGEPMDVRMQRVGRQVVIEMIPAIEGAAAAGIASGRSPIGAAIGRTYGVQRSASGNR